MSSAAILSFCLWADEDTEPSVKESSTAALASLVTGRLRKSRFVKGAIAAVLLYAVFMLSQFTARNHIGHELRLLALGDSITWGYGSSDFNGYRGPLLEALVGARASFVGGEQTGAMANNAHEGRPGGRIAAAAEAAAWGLDERPNVILLHIGSNDLIYGADHAEAPARLEQLLDAVGARCPDAVVLLAKLGPSWNVMYTDRFAAFNEALEPLVRARRARGDRILLLDVPAVLSPTEDFVDDLHPNDKGYRKMAAVWLAGIREAARRGWVEEPMVVEYADESAPQVL